VTYGTQFAASEEPPPRCPVCEDPRQYVPASGRRWTTMAELRAGHVNRVSPELELTGTVTEPSFAIGQRCAARAVRRAAADVGLRDAARRRRGRAGPAARRPRGDRDYATERESDFGICWSLGWPYETAAALSRLVYSGQMDRHPRLRVIAHHGGGMVPHFSARLAMGPGYRQTKESLPLPPLDYFHRFYADTALFGAPHAVRCVIEFFGPERVLFGTDTPLGPPHAIEATIADLGAAELSEAELAAVYAGNAQRLLGVR